MTSFIIPAIIAFILIFGAVKGVNVFDEFIAGAKEGIKTSVSILPALIALMTCVGMFKASGGLDVITYALSPITELLHIPKEIVPLALLRPISGSGALCVYKDILSSYGADSTTGRIASVLMGSSETTFYTIAVYFGAARVHRTRHTAVCSLSADLIAFIASAICIYMIF